MRTNELKLGAATALAAAAVLLAPTQALAIEYYLRAEATSVDMPNPTGVGTVPVAMWGYASCTAAFASCQQATVPGPALSVPAGDTVLTVHLVNNLAVPTSLVINGLYKSMAPVWSDGSSGPRPDLAARVRSFDAEAGPGAQVDYTWNNVQPGTYLYQSGTQPQVQVQMGLYGGLTKNFADGSPTTQGQAYTGVFYDNQATLLYSEIDPDLHAAVAGGTYGTTGPTSTLDYAPKYFLVNGQPYPFGTSVITPSGNPGTTLLRMLNAGLKTRVPMIQGSHWTLVAEDGKAYPYRRHQYTALLSAAKTTDMLLTPDAGGANYAVYDRRLGLSNAGLPTGGMLTVLQYGGQGVIGGGSGSGNVPPGAVNDSYDAVVGVTLSVGATEGVLFNDLNTDGLPLPIRAVAASGPTTNGGNYVLNTNGSFTYTPSGNATTSDTFTYQVTDGSALGATAATVTISRVMPTAPSPAEVDNFNRTNSSSLGANWVQTANTVTSVPDLGIFGNGARANTVTIGGLAIWNPTTFGAKQGASFTAATSLANLALVLKATGGTTAAPANYVRVRCEVPPLPSSPELVIATMMGGSNVSMYVKQAGFATPSCSGGGTLRASVDAKGIVTAFIGTSYIGGVQLPDVGAWKGGGRVGIQLQTQGSSVDDFSAGNL